MYREGDYFTFSSFFLKLSGGGVRHNIVPKSKYKNQGTYIIHKLNI